MGAGGGVGGGGPRGGNWDKCHRITTKNVLKINKNQKEASNKLKIF